MSILLSMELLNIHLKFSDDNFCFLLKQLGIYPKNGICFWYNEILVKLAIQVTLGAFFCFERKAPKTRPVLSFSGVSWFENFLDCN